MSKAGQIRDMKDTVTILRALAAHNPFSLDTNNNLRNIMNGVNADSSANADTAKSVREKILSSMNGKLATDYAFKRSAQAVTMPSKSSVKITDDQVQVDPQLLFQRLIIACDNSQIEELFLRQVPWPRDSPTYKVVCDLYCTYVQRKCGRATVVFDGINEMSAKAMTQQRSASGKAASTVTFTESMSVTLKKDNFLLNPRNKQRFLSMLSKALQNVGCITHHANGDADLLIVKTAVESARTSTTVLVGDDRFAISSVLSCFRRWL